MDLSEWLIAGRTLRELEFPEKWELNSALLVWEPKKEFKHLDKFHYKVREATKGAPVRKVPLRLTNRMILRAIQAGAR
jgi:hypothetical protein